jgi:imidazolonepropionase-like amidohydrolase
MKTGLSSAVLFAIATSALWLAPAALAQPGPGLDDPLALVGGTVITAPDAQPIPDGVVLVQLGRIMAVGSRDSVKLPRACATLDCRGATVTAGFWNCSAHFAAPEWQLAETLSVAHLEKQMRAALTRYGFTSAVALGGGDNAEQIQQRIEKGEVAGPRVLRGGVPIAPAGAPETPGVTRVYTPAQAEDVADSVLSHGADFVELVTGYGPGGAMSLDLAYAITDRARRWGQLAFARPQQAAGTMVAVRGGADVLVGSLWAADTLTSAQIDTLRMAGVSLIPGGMARGEAPGRGGDRSHPEEQVRRFAAAGGQVLFGSDNGGDPTGEYRLLARAGLDWRAILRSLTIAPAERFELAYQSGAILTGRDADLCVLEGDPTTDVQAFAHLRYALRGGRMLYDARAEEARPK